MSKHAPLYDHIWLQVDPEGDRPDHDSTYSDEVTWCQDQINDNDIKYLHATPIRAAAPDLLNALQNAIDVLGTEEAKAADIIAYVHGHRYSGPIFDIDKARAAIKAATE